MVLVDWQIERLCNQGMINPYDPNLLNAASLDVRIGETAKTETEDGWLDVDLLKYTLEDPFWIYPKEFLLAATLETFNMPKNVAAEFKVKSSRAREGYSNLLAVWLDPSWHNSKLTLELINENRFNCIPLYPGLKIGQIIFYATEIPRFNYAHNGRYNNDLTVQESKG